MKKLSLTFLLFSNTLISQTLIKYDYMETWNWAGGWNTAANTGWYTNAFVSSNQSAAINGGGNGASPIEDNWYRLPNVAGLDATKQYQFRFRLASYTFSNSTATTRGVDAADYVSVQVSTNGGAYVNELRITGNSNATWPYNTTGTITHTANGTFTNSAAPTGDVYQSGAGTLTDGSSAIALNLPLGTTQVAVDIYCRVNSAGEEWWIDNVELWDITPVPLPIELSKFDGTNNGEDNYLFWSTTSEHNTSYFELQKSRDGENWIIISTLNAAGNSSDNIEYNAIDYKIESIINYYRIQQYDLDGTYKTYGPIAINNTTLDSKKTIVKYINLRGQEIDPSQFTSTGIYLEVYSDGTIKRVYK